MKKQLVTFLLACLATTTVMAQWYDSPAHRYSVSTNTFWSNWYVQGSFSYGTTSVGDARWNFFNSRSNNPGFGAAVGKWITPGFGLRAKYMGVEARCDDRAFVNNVWRVDGMFNFSSLFAGYNEARHLDISLLTGFGGMRRSGLWTLGAHAGYSLTHRLGAFAEASLMLSGRHGRWLNIHRGWNQRSFALEVGVTWNLGRTGWNRTPDVDAINALNRSQIEVLRNELSNLQSENTRLKSMLKKQDKKQ